MAGLDPLRLNQILNSLSSVLLFAARLARLWTEKGCLGADRVAPLELVVNLSVEHTSDFIWWLPAAFDRGAKSLIRGGEISARKFAGPLTGVE